MNWVTIFIIMIIVLTIAGLEGERIDPAYIKWVELTEERHNGLTDAENWALQDSLQAVIDSIMVEKK